MNDLDRHNTDEIMQSHIATIQNQMQLLGYEYGIAKDNKTISLYIKLEKSRVLKMWFSHTNSTECILRGIGNIGNIAKTINGIKDIIKFGCEKSSEYRFWKINQRIREKHQPKSLPDSPVTELIRQKMESLGLEYNIEQWAGFNIVLYKWFRSIFTLRIRLKNKLVIRTLFSYNLLLEKTRQRLEMIEDAVKKLNDIHANFTIIRPQECYIKETLIVDEFEERKTINHVFEECWNVFSAKFPSVPKPALHIIKIPNGRSYCDGRGITIEVTLAYSSYRLQRHVVFHELCHLIQMGHSKRFYDVLGMFVSLPNPLNYKIEGSYQATL